MSGVGISFGADRIFDVMNQLDLFPKDNMTTTQILFVNFGKRKKDIVYHFSNNCGKPVSMWKFIRKPLK